MSRHFTSVSSALLLLLQNYVATLFTVFSLALCRDINLKCHDKILLMLPFPLLCCDKVFFFFFLLRQTSTGLLEFML